jgi:hypothetical protein
MFGLGYQEALLIVVVVGLLVALAGGLSWMLSKRRPPMGWLALFGLTVVLAPFNIGWGAAQAFVGWSAMSRREVWIAAAIGVVGWLLVVWSIYNLVLFFSQDHRFPFAWGGLQGVMVLSTIVAMVRDPQYLERGWLQLVWIAVLSAYMLMSRRVKNTFCDRREVQAPRGPKGKT